MFYESNQPIVAAIHPKLVEELKFRKETIALKASEKAMYISEDVKKGILVQGSPYLKKYDKNRFARKFYRPKFYRPFLQNPCPCFLHSLQNDGTN